MGQYQLEVLADYGHNGGLLFVESGFIELAEDAQCGYVVFI